MLRRPGPDASAGIVVMSAASARRPLRRTEHHDRDMGEGAISRTFGRSSARPSMWTLWARRCDDPGCLRFHVLQREGTQRLRTSSSCTRTRPALESHRTTPALRVWRWVSDVLEGPTEPTRLPDGVPAARAYWGRFAAALTDRALATPRLLPRVEAVSPWSPGAAGDPREGSRRTRWWMSHREGAACRGSFHEPRWQVSRRSRACVPPPSRRPPPHAGGVLVFPVETHTGRIVSRSVAPFALSGP